MSPPGTPASETRSLEGYNSTYDPMETSDSTWVRHLTHFSRAVKRAKRRYWVCGYGHPQTAHVFAQADPTVSSLVTSMKRYNQLISYDMEKIWIQKMLLDANFDPAAIENVIALCGTCQVKFNNKDDPGIVFFPVDLNFFTKYELTIKDKEIIV